MINGPRGVREKPTNVRQWVLFWLVLHFGNTYMDRIAIAQAAPMIREDFGMDQATLGLVFAAFTISYAAFQIPGGWLADRFGPRKILTAIVSYWSVFTMLTAAAWNTASLMVIRFLFGSGEAGAFPAATRAMSKWFPVSERGFAQGITHSGARLAGAFTPPLVAFIMVLWGWRWAFVLLGLTGIVWAVIWHGYYRDDPQTHPRMNDAERDLIRRTTGDTTEELEGSDGSVNPDDIPVVVERVPWKRILSNPNMLVLALMYMCYAYTFWIFLTWIPTYMVEGRGFGILAGGVAAGLPLLAGAITNTLGGWLSDKLIPRYGLTKARRWPAFVGFVTGISFIIPGVLTENPYLAVAFLTLAAAGLEFTTGISWAVTIDIGGEHAGVVSAVMNTAGNAGGIFSPIIFGVLVQWTGRWELPFLLASGLCVIAAICWLRIDAGRSVVLEEAAA